jgi:hypothetical protein
MSEPKVQLVDPQGNMSVTGMSAVGVITASSFDGISNSSATGITGNPDLNLGIVTATSFVGQGKGHAAGLAGTPELNLGVTTATSFVGDATGKAAGLTGTPNLNVGLVTATGFAGNVTGTVTGNVTGLAVSITPGSNLGLGVCTAIQYHGDGSTLTGAGSSAFIAQEITALDSETIIDLSDGNLIYYKGVPTTVGFASTSAAEQITFIRSTSPTFDQAYNVSYSTGAVDFDGTGDFLTLGSSSDFNFGTGDYTAEAWLYPDNVDAADAFVWLDFGNTDNPSMKINNGKWEMYIPNPVGVSKYGPEVTAGQWYHVAISRSSGTNRMFVNGVLANSWADAQNIPTQEACIGAYPAGTYEWDGKISNLRVVKGRGLYTANFVPPTAALTNVSGTVLLCCQDTSSATVGAVKPGTITANGTPTAGAQTVSKSGTNTLTSGVITWPPTVRWNNNTAPTLIDSSFPSSFQIFRLTTVDTGLNYNAWEQMEEDSNNHTMFGTNKIATRWLNGAVTRYSSPIQLEGNNFKNLFGDSGSENVYALKNDGTMWGAGRNTWGQLGQNTQSSTGFSSPIQIPGTNWKQGSTNGYTVIANKTDGTLWAWGYGGQGNLGDNENANAGNAYAGDLSSPAQIGTGTDWKEPGHGAGDCSQAFKTNGTMWVWGTNEHGKLGLNQSSPSATKSSPTQVPGTTWNLGATATSGRNSAAIKTDGTLWIWGTNENGQLGQNTPSGTLDGRSSPAQVGTDTTWANIVWTQYTAYAVKTDASLWQWGQDLYATNDTVHRSSPTQIPGDWSVNLSASRYTASCVKTDGTLWAWGRAYQGIFGQNLDQDGGLFYSSPIQIPGTWSTQKNRLCVSNDVLTVLKED